MQNSRLSFPVNRHWKKIILGFVICFLICSDVHVYLQPYQVVLSMENFLPTRENKHQERFIGQPTVKIEVKPEVKPTVKPTATPTVKPTIKPAVKIIPTRKFEDILAAKHQPRSDGGNVFFLETHRNLTQLYLAGRQACSVESAALNNPELNIYLLIPSTVSDIHTITKPLVEALLSYKNVHIYTYEWSSFSKNTPLEAWLASGKLFSSQFVVTHSSDILRILTLWKYTGTYFDLDVLELKPIKERGKNFAGIEEEGTINSAILNLDNDLGKKIAEENFKRVIAHFDGSKWLGNGPDVMTNIIKERCNTSDHSKMTRENCKGFRVYPPTDFYPIHWHYWREMFEPQHANHTLNVVKDAFSIHYWNNASCHMSLSTNSGAGYIKLAQKFCPRALAACAVDKF